MSLFIRGQFLQPYNPAEADLSEPMLCAAYLMEIFELLHDLQTIIPLLLIVTGIAITLTDLEDWWRQR